MKQFLDGDVQSRQALVVDAALQAAQADQLDFLLHIDIDELLFCPCSAHQRDIRRYFATIPRCVWMHRRVWLSPVCRGADAVRFSNLEIVPEAFDVLDWFTETDLFKGNGLALSRALIAPGTVNKDFIAGTKGQLYEQTRAARRAERAKLVDRAGPSYDFEVYSHNSADPKKKGELVPPETLSSLLEPVRSARLEIAIKPLLAAGLELPAPPAATALPQYVLDGIDPEEDFAAQWQKEKEKPGSSARRAGPRPTVDPDYNPEHDFIADYYNAYENGKCAARIRPRPGQVPGGGVHGVTGCGYGGTLLTCNSASEPLAPVVLHYANCGFSYWKRKYEVLGDFPDPEPAGAVDGEARPSMLNNMRSHLVARELVVKLDSAATADPVQAKQADAALRLFYDTWIRSNQHGELPYLAAFGLLVRLDFPRLLIQELRAASGWPQPLGRPSDQPRPQSVIESLQAAHGLEEVSEQRLMPRWRRCSRWKVVFESRVVSRTRPSVKAAPNQVLEPGTVLWVSHTVVGRDGLEFLVLADTFGDFLLVDATSIGHGRLVEQLELPARDPETCVQCWYPCSECVCPLLQSFGV